MGSFEGVVTTGIYCLPPCPGRPRAENIVTFASAAGAEAAGFRACHRCRPYRGDRKLASASELVCRAIDLIAAGALDEGDEVALAARLAVSERHLRRMFQEQVGATPDQLARSRRAHFARRLLDDTDLSVTDIAFAAGFGSLRQFNRVMVAIFRATPVELRKRRRRTDRLVADGGLALRVPVAEGTNVDRRLAQLARTAIAGVESATPTCYRRTIVLDGDPGVIEITTAATDAVRLVVHVPHIEGLIHLVARVQRLLVGHPWDSFEDDIRGIVSDSDVLDDLVTAGGVPIAGLRQFGLTYLFPTPSQLATADLTGIDIIGAQAIRACVRDNRRRESAG
ncbi:helix-turn-helix domain-containing protein [Nocardia sp. NPDC049707]|uniref:helix-turn-helix domain-containing protein n=1 Tax=Nocardia sp. NPDC049707 TaxID=3154735 RepID=UPI003441654B